MNKSWHCVGRKIKKRLLVYGVLELVTPAHIGGTSAASVADQPILRDHSGRPFVPGTTLAGLLRSYANHVLGGGKGEDSRIAQVFGCRCDRVDEPQSALIVDDAPMEQSQPGRTELRDGVKIDAAKGTVKKGKKFDMELLPVASRFELRFELLLSGDREEDSLRLSIFFTALKGLQDKRIPIGARVRRGLGRCRASGWTYKIYDVASKRGLVEWLGGEGGVDEDWPQVEKKVVDGIEDMAKAFGVTILSREKQSQMIVTMDLFCPGSFLIGSAGFRPEDADSIHLQRGRQGRVQNETESPQSVLTGTSLGGAMRQRAFKIANTLASKLLADKPQDLVDNLFGKEMKNGAKPSASKVWVEEQVLTGQFKALRHTRVSIDAWRGSSLKHMLLEEDAVFGGRASVSFSVEGPEDHEIGMVLCLVKDLFTGDLPLGGETGIGRGIFLGKEANVFISNGNGEERIRLKGDEKGGLEVTGGEENAAKYFHALNAFLQGS